MNLYPTFTADVLTILTKSSSVRHYHGNVFAFVDSSCGVAICVFGGVVVFIVIFNFSLLRAQLGK